MGKNRQRQNRSSDGGSSKSSKSRATTSSSTDAADLAAAKAASSSKKAGGATKKTSFFQWIRKEKQGVSWVIGCSILGALLGFGMGTGHLTGAHSQPVSPWRKTLARKLRATTTYQVLTLRRKPWAPVSDLWHSSMSLKQKRRNLMRDPSNPMVFYLLREGVEREGGFVHRDLGMLVPAPSGAARGIGMVRDGYTKCQTKCNPGNAPEKLQYDSSNRTEFSPEEVLIKIPLAFQMTRKVAMDTLLPLIPGDGRKEPLQELDDAALLVLLLAHERALARVSKWAAYLVSLPNEPSCGYSTKLRPYMLDAVAAYGGELGVDTTGWPRELGKAGKYAEKIASGLNRDYGGYISTPRGMTTQENIEWALCQVASRATAGSGKHGALRLVPIIDLINHDVNAGGFVELTGKESLKNGDFYDAVEDDEGAFVVRSLRHGRRKPLKKGQELLANYNVPGYTPLDWLISLGFVPPERWHQWQKIDAALPRVRSDGPFGANASPLSRRTKKEPEQEDQSVKDSEL